MIMLTQLNLGNIEMPLLISKAFPYLIFYFIINFSSVFILSRVLYYKNSRKKEYLFTYIGISNTIFLLCFTLDNVEMKLGLALGLFAIFGIIRYRTSQVSIKEMTYLFIIIGISVINALANHKIGLAELLFANIVLIGGVWLKESLLMRNKETYKIVQYDVLEYIKPENHSKLKQDLETRMGFPITRIEIGKVNLLRDSVQIRIYFMESPNSIVGNFVVTGTDNDTDDD
jgi:hypothetical protein